MSDLIDIMHKRHTVRSYADRLVEPEKLSAILEAGRWAPTAVNGQPQRITVLDTSENLAKVREFLYLRLEQALCRPCRAMRHP